MFKKNFLKRTLVGFLTVTLLLGNVTAVGATSSAEELTTSETVVSSEDTTTYEANEEDIEEESENTNEPIENEFADVPNTSDGVLDEGPVAFDDTNIASNTDASLEEVGEEVLAGDVVINETNFPDEGFRSFITAKYDTNKDGIFSPTEINNALTFEVKDGDKFATELYTATDFTGLSFFTSMVSFRLEKTDAVSIDFSGNSKLKGVTIKSAQNLKDINITKNIKLETLYIESADNLTNIDISNNIKLRNLFIYNSPIKSLDLTNNIVLWDFRLKNCSSLTTLELDTMDLTTLYLEKINIDKLNIGKCTKLTQIIVKDCPITNLYLSKDLTISSIDIRNTSLTNLDISQLTNIQNLYLSNNKIKKLNINNSVLAYLYILNDFNNNSFEELTLSNCSSLVELTLRNINTKTIDFSKGTKLKNVSITKSNVSSLDFSNCDLLSSLKLNLCPDLKNLKLTKGSDLKTLDLKGVILSNINTSIYPILEDLRLEASSLSSMDLSKNTSLLTLHLYNGSKIKTLDLSKNIALQGLRLEGCGLNNIDLSNNSKLAILNLKNTDLKTLDLTNNPNIKTLILINTALKSLDLNNLKKLDTLICEGNYFTHLNYDVPSNDKLSVGLLTIPYWYKNFIKGYEIIQGNGGLIKSKSCIVETDKDNKFDTKKLSGFEPDRILSISGGTINNGIITFTSDKVTYTYVIDKKASTSSNQVIGEFTLVNKKVPTVSYRTHVQSYGWQGWKKNGQMSGTSGEAKRLEGIEIKLSDNENLGIKYRTHVQSYGWQDWKSNGKMSGTSGEAKRLEAIQIELTGTDKDKYDVYYRVHAQSYGWLGWAKNGEMSGTAGQGKRLEAIEIKIVKKGAFKPSNTYLKYIELGKTATNKNTAGLVNYRTHVQSYGWQSYVYDGSVSGTLGEGKRLESININLSNAPYSGNIEYRTHIQSYGWQGWKKNGQMSGTSGEAKRLEAIEIKLTGEMAKKYDVYYRVHSQSYGWLGWAKNGASAGTSGLAKRLEAIQIVVVPKGTTITETSTYKAYVIK